MQFRAPRASASGGPVASEFQGGTRLLRTHFYTLCVLYPLADTQYNVNVN